jgi:GntR family transcriptional repressor for pyruvate dehydrogenase complex
MVTADLEPIDFSRHEPVSAEVTQRLLAYLLSGRFRPGDRIPPERRLAESLGVGRYVVREALKSFALLGVVEVRVGDGTYLGATRSDVLPQVIDWGVLLTPQQRHDIEEARYYIEPIVAGLAAERRDEATLADLRAIFAEMEGAADRRAHTEADLRFHTRIAEAAGNDALSRIVGSLRSLLRVWMGTVTEASSTSLPGHSEHAAILAAVTRGDAKSAREAAAFHCSQASLRWEALEALRTAEGVKDGVPSPQVPRKARRRRPAGHQPAPAD